MKKLFIALPFVLLTACTTGPSNHVTADKTINTIKQSTPVVFDCSDDSMIAASYSKDGSMADLQVILPKLNLLDQQITLKQAVSGSGMRFINNANPKATFEWHTKADEGVFAVTWASGQEYRVVCNKED